MDTQNPTRRSFLFHAGVGSAATLATAGLSGGTRFFVENNKRPAGLSEEEDDAYTRAVQKDGAVSALAGAMTGAAGYALGAAAHSALSPETPQDSTTEPIDPLP